MMRTFKAHTTIAANKDTTWNAVSSSCFVKDFLPEVYKDISGLSFSYLAMHKNDLVVMPAYVVPTKTIHWNNNSTTSIKLARNDLNVTIDHIEISLEAKGDSTIVMIEVEYDSRLGAEFMLIKNIIQTLFSHKLTILKQDLEKNKHVEFCLPTAFA